MRRIAVALSIATMLAASPLFAASAEELLQEAQRLEKAGNDQDAVKVYEEYLTKFSDHSQRNEALYRQAKCLDSLGLAEPAVEKLKVVLNADRKSFRNKPEALFLLGRLYASLKDYKNAADAYEKLLAEGAGLNEDEALNLCAGWYALQDKFDDAAAKFNLLKRKKDSPLAETAAYKLVLLWLRAEKFDNAVLALQDMAQIYPKSEHLPELMLRLADAYRKAGKIDKTIALCGQLGEAYPKSPEALAARYLLAVCHKDQKDAKKAAEAFEEVAKAARATNKLIAADALAQAAELYRGELNNTPLAMQKYEDAAVLARETDGERRGLILETCWFNLAEHYFAQKKYQVALEYYLQLRNLGTKINILGRIMACQNELKQFDNAMALSQADIEAVRKKVAENVGTTIAAEAEVYLLDRRFHEAMRGRGDVSVLGPEYEKLLTTYKPDVLATDGLDLYILQQTGICYGNGNTKAQYEKAVAAFEKALVVGKDNVANRITCLENIALAAERFSDTPRARKAYAELFALTKKKVDEQPDDKAANAKATEYLKAMLTRADNKDAVQSALETAQKIIDEKGALSDMGRAAKFYMGELYFIKKDFSAAAKHYADFIKIYGPKQDSEGDIVDAPYRPKAIDEPTEQLYEAAVRIAHCWYLQGHEQNTAKAYTWMVKNFPVQNRYMPEAQYHLALELAKGKAGESKEAKRKFATAMWQKVVNTSLDFEAKDFSKKYHPWVNNDSERYEAMQEYVRMAVMRSGQAFSEAGDNELAAHCFRTYLELFAPRQRNNKRNEDIPPDPQLSIARYALGREYITLKSPTRLVEAYKPYLTGLRDDKFRISSLKLLGYHAGKAELWDVATDAYATLLDEYGSNKLDAKGRPIPVPSSERIRTKSGNWDGIRMPPPKDFNTAEIRYALGFQMWRKQDYARCVVTLRPFLDDPALKFNNFRERALFMAGQSAFKLREYSNAAPLLLALIREYPNHEAAEEAHTFAAQALVETRQWDDLTLVYRNFIKVWPRSNRRPKMDLTYAMGLSAQDKPADAVPIFRNLAEGDTFEDVKADAWYQLGLASLRGNDPQKAATQFEKSVSIYARDKACLAAAKAFRTLKQDDKAMTFLDRIDRDFAENADRALLDEAKAIRADIERARLKSGKKN